MTAERPTTKTTIHDMPWAHDSGNTLVTPLTLSIPSGFLKPSNLSLASALHLVENQ